MRLALVCSTSLGHAVIKSLLAGSGNASVQWSLASPLWRGCEDGYVLDRVALSLEDMELCLRLPLVVLHHARLRAVSLRMHSLSQRERRRFIKQVGKHFHNSTFGVPTP